MEICKVCGVEKHGLLFKTDHDRRNNTVSNPDLVRTRICRHAKKQGCINVEGKVNASLDYNNLGITAEQWVDVAKQLIAEQATSTPTAKRNLRAVPDDRLAS